MADPQTFLGVDRAKWERIKLEVLNKAGIGITSDYGSGSAKGITLSWSYSPDSQALIVTMVKRSFFDPSESVIDTDIAAMVAAA